MKLTKYEHSCFAVEKDDVIVLVDPGNLTDDLTTLNNVAAIVVTHEHHDHFDVEKLRAIAADNPDVTVYGPHAVIEQLSNSMHAVAVEPGQTVENGPFKFEFFGGEHQKPFTDSPTIANVAVLINDALYHASDSFVNPGKHVDTLLVPVCGSWMSTQMARDFLFDIKPRLAIPTHDAILSDKGKKQVDKYWPLHAEKVGASYLRPNEPIEIDG